MVKGGPICHLKGPVIPLKAFKRHKVIATLMTITILALSQSSFYIPFEISLNNNTFYTSPPRKSIALPQHYTITVSEKGVSSTP